jgi:Transglycosylase SLT domain
VPDPGSEYGGLSWQQIQDDILSGDPGSLSAAADVFSGIQQGLSAVAQTVNAALGTLTGGSGSPAWQGPAAQAFATATGSLVSGIQSLGEVLQSSGGGSFSDLLNENGSRLSWAQNQIQSIGAEFATAAAQAGAPVSQSGLVSPPTSMSEKITAEMLAVLEQLAQDYDQTITALQSQIPTNGVFGSGTDSDDGSTSGGGGSSSSSSDPGGASPHAASGAPPVQAAFATSGAGSNTDSSDSDTSDNPSADSGEPDVSGNSNADSGGPDTSENSNPPTVSSDVSGASSATPAGSDSSSGSGSSVNDWINSAFSVLEANGVPASQLNSSDVNLIIQHESGGDPGAVNNWDSNAAAGDPSQGLMQTTGQTFNAYALPGYNSNILDPVSNIIAGVRYALATYGSLNNVPGVVAVDSGGSYVGY